MMLSVADFDRLLDAGLVPVSKVPLTTKGTFAVENLGEETFTLKDGSKATRIVWAVDGTACLTFVDGSGKDFYMPLQQTQVKKQHRKKRPQISTHWTIPDNPLVPANLVGATVRVRHTRTNSERIAGKSRSRALRIFPESDDRFDGLFGLREDSESANSDYKNRLWNRRCRTMGHESVEFNNIGYQIHVLITALVAYHNRTGADMTEWFGLHELPTKTQEASGPGGLTAAASQQGQNHPGTSRATGRRGTSNPRRSASAASRTRPPIGSNPKIGGQLRFRAGNRAPPALVAQWIEHRSPKPCAQVRFLPGAHCRGHCSEHRSLLAHTTL